MAVPASACLDAPNYDRETEMRYLSACRGLGSAVGPLLAARALPLRCAASTMLSPALLAI